MPKKKSFEESLSRLEEIVSSLDNDKATLEESLAMYEEGVRLVSECNGMLENAERRIKVLQMGESGAIEEVDLLSDKEKTK